MASTPFLSSSLRHRLLCLIICCLAAATAYPQDSNFQQRKDSLLQQVSQTQGAEKLQAYKQLVNLLVYTSDPDTVILYLTRYEQEALDQQQLPVAGGARGSLSTALYNHGRYEELIARAPDDLAFIAETKAWNAYFKSYDNLVGAYFFSGKHEKTIEVATRCYEEAKNIDAPEARTWPLYILGETCIRNDRFSEGDAYLRQCIDMAGSDEACIDVKMNAYMDLGRSYYSQDKTDELSRLLPVWEAEIQQVEAAGKKDVTSHWSNFYIVCTNYYLDVKDYDKLEKYCDLIEQSVSSEIIAVKLAVLKARQNLAMTRGQYEQVLGYIHQRSEIYIGMGSIEGQFYSLRDKAYTLVHLGRADESIDTFEQVLALKDSTLQLDVQAQLDELRTIYEVDKLTAEKERNRSYFLFALSGCALLALLLGIWIYYNRQIARKNRTLARHIRELTEQQEIRDNEMLRRTSFLPADDTTVDEDGFCPDTRKDQLCIAIRDIILKEKIYRDPTITRDYVIERLGTSKDLFIDAFQYCFGLSFPEYINSLRLKDAINLLEQSDLSIEVISEKVGFGTIRTFQRQFQSRFNMSPKDYRNLPKN